MADNPTIGGIRTGRQVATMIQQKGSFTAPFVRRNFAYGKREVCYD